MLQRIAAELLSSVTVAIVSLSLPMCFGIVATGTSEGALAGIYGATFAGTRGQATGITEPIIFVSTGTIAAHGLEGAFADRQAHSSSPISGTDELLKVAESTSLCRKVNTCQTNGAACRTPHKRTRWAS